MKKITLPFFCLLMALSWSCSKDNDAPNIEPGTYNTGNTVTLHSVVMYTNKGQIKDRTIIEPFLKNHDRQNEFHFEVTAKVNNDNVMSLDFVNNKKVVNTIPSPFEYEVLSKNNSEWILASVLKYINGSSCGNTCTNFFDVNPNKYFVPWECLDVGRVEKDVFSLRIKNGAPVLPVYSMFVRYRDRQCENGRHEYHNIFNEKFISSLQNGDTLVVQTGEIPLIRQ